MKTCTITLLIFLAGVSCFDEEGGVFGKLKTGLHLAGKLLGFDESSGVAQLVSQAFGKSPKRKDEFNRDNIFSGFLRILGFDTKRIGAIAVNAVIFVAQLVCNF